MTLLRTLAVRAVLGSAAAIAALPAAAQAAAGDQGCAGAVAHWQEFAAQEDQGGHMDDSVYKQIQAEIERASGLCQAGQDAQARRAVDASMRRHGY